MTAKTQRLAKTAEELAKKAFKDFMPHEPDHKCVAIIQYAIETGMAAARAEALQLKPMEQADKRKRVITLFHNPYHAEHYIALARFEGARWVNPNSVNSTAEALGWFDTGPLYTLVTGLSAKGRGAGE